MRIEQLRRYYPPKGGNRMKLVGDARAARERYFSGTSPNLRVLLEKRYLWMNDFIGPSDSGVEVGAASGLSREFIRCPGLKLTDVSDYEWLDLKNVDALALPFEAGSLDFVMETNVVHHLSRPLRFFREAARVLKPNGKLIMCDVHCSLALRAALRAFRHEGFDFGVDVFDETRDCTDPDDPWAANNAIVDLLLDEPAKLRAAVPELELVHHEELECLTFFNSGGVTARTLSIPLPLRAARALDRLDDLLTRALPDLLACTVHAVFEKRA